MQAIRAKRRLKTGPPLFLLNSYEEIGFALFEQHDIDYRSGIDKLIDADENGVFNDEDEGKY